MESYLVLSMGIWGCPSPHTFGCWPVASTAHRPAQKWWLYFHGETKDVSVLGQASPVRVWLRSGQLLPFYPYSTYTLENFSVLWVGVEMEERSTLLPSPVLTTNNLYALC